MNRMIFLSILVVFSIIAVFVGCLPIAHSKTLTARAKKDNIHFA
jgi:hypothetical protein